MRKLLAVAMTAAIAVSPILLGTLAEAQQPPAPAAPQPIAQVAAPPVASSATAGQLAVAADARSPRDGRFIEQLGTYDPLLEGTNFTIDLAIADKWLAVGAKPSETVNSMIRKARTAAAAAGTPADAAVAARFLQPRGRAAATPDRRGEGVQGRRRPDFEAADRDTVPRDRGAGRLLRPLLHGRHPLRYPRHRGLPAHARGWAVLCR